MKQARKSGVIEGILNMEEGPHFRDWLQPLISWAQVMDQQEKHLTHKTEDLIHTPANM